MHSPFTRHDNAINQQDQDDSLETVGKIEDSIDQLKPMTPSWLHFDKINQNNQKFEGKRKSQKTAGGAGQGFAKVVPIKNQDD